MSNIHSKMSQLTITARLGGRASASVVILPSQLRNPCSSYSSLENSITRLWSGMPSAKNSISKILGKFPSSLNSRGCMTDSARPPPVSPQPLPASLQTSHMKRTSRGSNSSSKTSPKLTSEVLSLNWTWSMERSWQFWKTTSNSEPTDPTSLRFLAQPTWSHIWPPATSGCSSLQTNLRRFCSLMKSGSFWSKPPTERTNLLESRKPKQHGSLQAVQRSQGHDLGWNCGWQSVACPLVH